MAIKQRGREARRSARRSARTSLDLNDLETLERLVANQPNAPKKNKALSALKTVGGILGATNSYVAGAAGAFLNNQNPLIEGGRAFSNSLFRGEQTSFSDVIKDRYTPETFGQKFAVEALGFTADVLTDPLTYLTFGLGKGIQVTTNTGARVLSKTGQKTLQQTSRKLRERGLENGEELVKEVIGKIADDGLDEVARVGFRNQGITDEVMDELVNSGSKLLDEGGIKFAGKSLVKGSTLAETKLGKGITKIKESEFVTEKTDALKTLFSFGGKVDPRISALLEEASAKTAKAADAIIYQMQQVFQGLNNKELNEFFDQVNKLKNSVNTRMEQKVAVQATKSVQDLKLIPELKGIKVIKTKGELTKEAKEALETLARKEVKKEMDAEKLTFANPKLQKLSNTLFEGDNSLVNKMAEAAGLPKDQRIKFYIPTKYEEYQKTKNGIRALSGMSGVKKGFLKRFRGTDREDLITDPFKLYTERQLEVTAARIKAETLEKISKEVGTSSDEIVKMAEDILGTSGKKLSKEAIERAAEKMGYAKISRETLLTTEQATRKTTAVKELLNEKNTKNRINKIVLENKEDIRNLQSQLRKLNKKGLQLSLRKEYLKKPETLKSRIEYKVKSGELVDNVPKNLDELKVSYNVKNKLAKEYGTKGSNIINLLKLEIKEGGWNYLTELGFTEQTAKSIAKQIFKKPTQKPDTITIIDEYISLSKKDPKRFIESQIIQEDPAIKTINKLIAEKNPKLKELLFQTEQLQNAVQKNISKIKEIKAGPDLVPDNIEFFVPKQAKEAIDDLFSPKDTTIDTIAKLTGFDFTTRLFKGFVTAPFPSFHTRNMTSNQFQNAIELGVNVLNPKLQKQGMDMALLALLKKPSMSAKLPGVAEQIAAKSFITKTGKEIKFGDLLEQIQNKTTFLDSGQYGNFEQMVEEASKYLNNKKFNFNRLNPISPEFAPVAGGRAVGNVLENQSKLVHIIAKVKDGFTLDEAIKSAEDVLFNYSKLTSFEKQFMRRIIPFYTFMSRNFALQARLLATRPGFVANQLKGFRAAGGLGTELTEEEEENLPDYILSSLGIPLGRNEQGQPQILTGFGLPIEEFLSRFSGEKGFMWNAISNTIVQSNPLIRFPIERTAEVDLFYGQPIAEIRNAEALKSLFDVMGEAASNQLKSLVGYYEKEVPKYVNGKVVGKTTKAYADPYALHFMRNLPTARLQSTQQFLSSDQQTIEGKALRVLTGARAYSADTERQKFFNELERKKELQKFLVDVLGYKTFETIYKSK